MTIFSCSGPRSTMADYSCCPGSPTPSTPPNKPPCSSAHPVKTPTLSTCSPQAPPTPQSSPAAAANATRYPTPTASTFSEASTPTKITIFSSKPMSRDFSTRMSSIRCCRRYGLTMSRRNFTSKQWKPRGIPILCRLIRLGMMLYDRGWSTSLWNVINWTKKWVLKLCS